MTTTKSLTIGRSQIVRLPQEFRFDCNEVYIRRDPTTGDVVLSRRPGTWDGFFALYPSTEAPADFMSEAERQQGKQVRDPFAHS
jgi:antitoxin VapB